VGEDVSSYCKASRKERILATESGSTRSHTVGNSSWKRQCNFRTTDYVMNVFPLCENANEIQVTLFCVLNELVSADCCF